MSIREFLDNNRRVGSTTALVHAAIAADGYLVVYDRDMANHLIHAYPTLLRSRVLTVGQLRQGKYPADKRPMFFDAPVLLDMDRPRAPAPV